MPPKKYAFYESDPILQQIFDELTKNKQLSPTIHRLAMNGLIKDVKQVQKDLKQRMKSMNKVEKLYKNLQTQEELRKEKLYNTYSSYRRGLIKTDMEYERINGENWIEKKAKELKIDPIQLLDEFEERFNKENSQ